MSGKRFDYKVMWDFPRLADEPVDVLLYLGDEVDEGFLTTCYRIQSPALTEVQRFPMLSKTGPFTMHSAVGSPGADTLCNLEFDSKAVFQAA